MLNILLTEKKKKQTNKQKSIKINTKQNKYVKLTTSNYPFRFIIEKKKNLGILCNAIQLLFVVFLCFVLLLIDLLYFYLNSFSVQVLFDK